MDDIEQRLKSARLAAPSRELDRRIDEIFSVAGKRPQRRRQPVLWWWLAAISTVCATCVVFFISSRQPLAPPEPLIYRVEASGRMRDMLLNPTARQTALPHFTVRVDVP